jgi:hypothetical protein
MNTKKTVFSKIAKGMPKKQVKLGLVDDFNYDYQYLDDQAGLLSYLAYEWHDEAFEEYRQAWMKLNDEYTHNGSTVVRFEDVEGDVQLLEEIRVKAEELGLDPNDVYDAYDAHLELLESVKEADDQYKRNEMQFRDWS